MSAINRYCPRSGKPVASDSLAEYRGVAVGFCNSGCRDDFVAHFEERLEDRQYFDVLIQEHDLEPKRPSPAAAPLGS